MVTIRDFTNGDPPDDGNVSILLEKVKTGNRTSVEPLFKMYIQRTIALAASRLRQRHFDGYAEDVALSALKSLCMGAEEGKFPMLSNRNELWSLLAVITIRKTIQLHRRKQLPIESMSENDLSQLIKGRLAQECELEIADQVESLLNKLDDDELRHIAIWKGEGFSNKEIAGRLGRTERTVERKLHRIRQVWQNELP